jgi:hypothetical protein
MTVEIRHDDQCKNGHNSFAITATVRTPKSIRHRDIAAGGCLHDDIAQVFPELAHLIKWHLSSTDGPWGYIGSTLHFAGDRDYNGLRKGEKRQTKNGRTGALCWELVAINSLGVGVSSTPTGDEYRHSDTVPLFILDKHCQGDTPPLATPVLKWIPSCRIGEGKARELEAARRVAVWPDATDEQLCLPRDELKALLEARLPALMDAFRADIESIGFQFAAVEDVTP